MQVWAIVIQQRKDQRFLRVLPNSDPWQIITSLVLVGLGLGVGEGEGLGLAISMRGVIIWQGVENGHTTRKGQAAFEMCNMVPLVPKHVPGASPTLHILHVSFVWHPFQVLEFLLMSWWVESGVIW